MDSHKTAHFCKNLGHLLLLLVAFGVAYEFSFKDIGVWLPLPLIKSSLALAGLLLVIVVQGYILCKPNLAFPLPTGWVVIGVLFFLWHLVVSLRSSPFMVWSVKYTLRLFGLAVFGLLMPVFVDTPKRLKEIVIAFVAGAASVALLGIIQYLWPRSLEGWQWFFSGPRLHPSLIRAVLSRPTILAAYLVSALPFLVSLFFWGRLTRFSRGWERLGLALVGVMIVVSLCATSTRGWIIGFLWGTGWALLIFCIRRWGLLPAVASLVIVVVVACCGIAILASTPGMRYVGQWIRLPALGQLAFWQNALRCIGRRPLQGVGPDIFRCVDIPPAAAIVFRPGLPGEFPFGHAHNVFLELAADTGLVGLGLFLALLATWFGKGMHVLSRLRLDEEAVSFSALVGSMGAMLALLGAGMTDFFFASHELITVFWLISGISLVVFQMHKDTGH